MSDSPKSLGRILYFALLAVHLTLAAAIFSWPLKDGPVVLTHSTLLNTAIASGFLLLLASLFCLKRFGRLAVCGLVLSFVILAMLLLPTV
jgi:hypothetical protein